MGDSGSSISTARQQRCEKQGRQCLRQNLGAHLSSHFSFLESNCSKRPRLVLLPLVGNQTSTRPSTSLSKPPPGNDLHPHRTSSSCQSEEETLSRLAIPL